MKKKFPWWIIVVPIVFLLFSSWLNHVVHAHYTALIAFIQQTPGWSKIVFVVIFSIAVCIGVPNPSFLFIGGLLFGIYEGFLLGVLASGIAIIFSFVIAKSLRRYTLFSRFIEKKIPFIVSAIRLYDWRMVLALRLNPVIPTTLINYYFGMTSIKFWFYLICSLISAAPFTLGYTALGVFTEKLITPPIDGQLEYTLAAVFILMAIISFYYVGRRFSRHILPSEEEKVTCFLPQDNRT